MMHKSNLLQKKIFPESYFQIMFVPSTLNQSVKVSNNQSLLYIVLAISPCAVRGKVGLSDYKEICEV